MNIPRLPNPDTIGEFFRSRGAQLTMAITLAGGIALSAACSEGRPAPRPAPDRTTTSTPAPAGHEALCAVQIRRGDKAREYLFSIKMTEKFLRGVRMVQKVEYDFNDGTPNVAQADATVEVPHALPRTSSVHVEASVYVEFAHGVAPDLGAPDKSAPRPGSSSGEITRVPCEPYVAVVE